MPGPAFLETERTALRSPDRDDLDWIRQVFHHEQVWGLGTYAKPSTADQLETFYEETLSNEDSVHLLVCVDPAGSPGRVEDRTEPVGLVAMTDHDPERGTAELATGLTRTPGARGTPLRRRADWSGTASTSGRSGSGRQRLWAGTTAPSRWSNGLDSRRKGHTAKSGISTARGVTCCGLGCSERRATDSEYCDWLPLRPHAVVRSMWY